MSQVDYDIANLIVLKETDPEKLLLINPVLRALVDGICDNNCPLSIFIGVPHIIQKIWTIVSQFWRKLIKKGTDNCSMSAGDRLEGAAFLELSGRLDFPKPSDININMMPFIMERTFDQCKLPKYLKPYWDKVINNCYSVGFNEYTRGLIPDSEYGNIGFLTIHECYVEENKTQRRPGLHTDCPGKLMVAPHEGNYYCIGRVTEEEETETYKILENKLGKGISRGKIMNNTGGWGHGYTQHDWELIGGIYMASNVSNSCNVWNCRILQGKNKEEIIGTLGDVEHLRDFLPKHKMMLPNKMYWITDRTPHESLPLKHGTYRQYFRLVTSNVSLWFEEHSTKNPLGVTPADFTTIVKGSKFNESFLLQDLKLDTGRPGAEDKKKRSMLNLE